MFFNYEKQLPVCLCPYNEMHVKDYEDLNLITA